MPKIHFARIRRRGGITITSTLCERMTRGDDINSTVVAADVTCKICLRLAADNRAFAQSCQAEKEAS
jgi:hypothetical protein